MGNAVFEGRADLHEKNRAEAFCNGIFTLLRGEVGVFRLKLCRGHKLNPFRQHRSGSEAFGKGSLRAEKRRINAVHRSL